MSRNNSITKPKSKYSHLDETERNLIEDWYHEGKTQTEIANLLGRNKSTISRELKRGQTTQVKQVNGYDRELEEYYAETGQANYEKNRLKSQSKGLNAFSQNFWMALKKANKERLFTGKTREYNIKTFTVVYKRTHPLENVPTFKTVYNYINRGDFFIKPIDLPVMVRLKPRKNKHSRPKGTNKRVYGRSISERPESIQQREAIGHWEADLVQGKKGKDEPVILTLVDRYSRFAISRKLVNSKSDTIQQALLKVTKEAPEAFDSITFDNRTEFSQAAPLEEDSNLDMKIYFCHAYSAWERGSNENFNKLLRDFMPKGVSINKFTDEEVIEAARRINKRVREVIDYRSAEEVFNKIKKQKQKNLPPRGKKELKNIVIS